LELKNLFLETAAIDRPKPQGRSRVSNGNRLFLDESVDGRSRAARRFRDVLADLCSHLGGEPTSAELLIAQRAAALAVWCEGREAELVAGGEINIAEFTTATNALRRLLADLGLERRARDVTPSLASYLEAKATQR
jgi:hypothetical protein